MHVRLLWMSKWENKQVDISRIYIGWKIYNDGALIINFYEKSILYELELYR